MEEIMFYNKGEALTFKDKVIKFLTITHTEKREETNIKKL